MTVLQTPAELLKALGKSAFAADPIADLAHRGFTLNPELEHEVRNALAGRKPTPLPAGLAPPGAHRKITFQQAPALPAAPPAPGTFDVVAGWRVSGANLVTEALFASGTIPHHFALDQLLAPGDLQTLESLFLTDKPGGHISQFHILSAPTLNTIRDGSTAVSLTIHFHLDWTRVLAVAGRRISQFVTKAQGAVELTMKLVPQVNFVPADPSRTTFTFAVKPDTDPTVADSPRITIDPASPVKLKTPAPPDLPDAAAKLLQDAIAKFFGNDLSWSVSGPIGLPIGHLDLRQTVVSTDGDVLLVGVQTVQGGQAHLGDPATLKSLIPSQDVNVFVRVLGGVADGLIKAALADGSLERSAQQDHSNARISAAKAWFQDRAIVVQMDGTLVDECPFNTDLDFTLTRTVTLRMVNATTVEVDQHDDQSILDLSNLPCFLATIGFLGLFGLFDDLLLFLISFVWPSMFGFLTAHPGLFLAEQLIQGVKGLFDGDAAPPLIDLRVPIPGTDYFPAVTGGFIQVTDGALFVSAYAGTLIDEEDTFMYVRFLVPDGASAAVGTTKPLAGVRVELMDQDLPAPAGDDAKVVVPPDKTIGPNTAKYSFVHGTDQLLAEGQTDQDGIVRLAVLKGDLRTSAGHIRRVIVNKTTGTDPDRTTLTPVNEEKPDLYFRVTMPDKSVVDTRKLPGGFMLNFSSARIGTLAQPLTFTLGGGTPIEKPSTSVTA